MVVELARMERYDPKLIISSRKYKPWLRQRVTLSAVFSRRRVTKKLLGVGKRIKPAKLEKT
jgi:hypothetical protein